jgi:hypothetical protein
MRQLDQLREEVAEQTRRLGMDRNYSYSGKMKDVWPPNPE